MEALGTLVGGIAHDFNNMLQIILGYSQLLLQDKKEGDSGCKDIQTIIETVKGGASLVKKLLAFGQQSPIFPVNMDLNHQIRELIPVISRTLPEIVKIDVDLTHGPVKINADPNQIDQVIMNLAINASEAMPNGGTLKMATKTMALEDEHCILHPGVKPGKCETVSVGFPGLFVRFRIRIIDVKVKTRKYLGQMHNVIYHYTNGHAVQPGRQRPAIMDYDLSIRQFIFHYL